MTEALTAGGEADRRSSAGATGAGADGAAGGAGGGQGEGVPLLAVVGHPNKGKSSLVATLAQDDSVAISANPGTTLRSRPYRMRVDGQHLYTLIDTPGFQRARRVLAWLEARADEGGANAADRPRLVREFVEAPGHDSKYPDECELLRPLTEGAGILYVVDGSVPYGPEYEAEMEILRWTGRPSMAVINPITSRDHVHEWEAALGQFFRVVRVIDAMHADFSTRRQLLLAFGELEASWRVPIESAVLALDQARDAQRRSAAREIAEMIADALALVVEHKLGPDEDARPYAASLEAEYQAALSKRESAHRRAVQGIYGHHEIDAHGAELQLLEADLFSEDAWLAFGLSRRDLVTAGAASGAATGGVVDIALGGASLLLGVAAGAAIGGVLGWFGAGRLAELKVVDRPLGGQLARFGPSKNPNFPFVLFGRARYHCGLLAARTHAMRDSLDLDAEQEVDIAARFPLESAQRSALDRSFGALRKAKRLSATQMDAINALAGVVAEILAADEERSR